MTSLIWTCLAENIVQLHDRRHDISARHVARIRGSNESL
jgi:hypothetical protein